MRKQYLSFVLAAAALTALAAAPAHAQVARTWVSAFGNDLNPCSRSAPCATFSGAQTKTQAGGEISVLDAGGFGSITINKSLSIVADGIEGGVLAAFANGIVVNVTASDVVSLRGLQIEGANSGLNGIKFTGAGTLHVENCVIRGFQAISAGNGHGIAFVPTGAGELDVTDTIIEKNGNGVVGGGILVKPAANGSAKVSLSGVTLTHNTFGLKADGSTSTAPAGIQGGVYDSTASGNAGTGFAAVTVNGFQGVNLMLSHSAAYSNGTSAVSANGAAATIRISDFTATANGTGLSAVGGSAIVSHENNSISGNGTDGAPTQQIGQL